MKTVRCEGPITKGSAELESDVGLIGCHDGKRIDAFYQYLQSLRPLPQRASRHRKLSFPSFVPVLESGMPKEITLPRERLYGISFKTVIDSYGNFHYRNAETLRHAVRLPSSARLALFLSATDKVIERAWKFSEQRDLWKRLTDFRFEFVTGGTFSVYDEDPRSDQIFNQDRNFRTYDLFTNLGVPCIPFLFFNPSSDRDYQAALNWLRKREDVLKLAVLAHCYRSDSAFRRMLTQTRTLVNNVGRHLQLMFVGVAKLERVIQILTEYPDAAFVTSQPIVKARAGERTMPSLEHIEAKEESKASLILENIKQFETAIEIERIKRTPICLGQQMLLPFLARRPGY